MTPDFLAGTVQGVSTTGSSSTELDIGTDSQNYEIILRETLLTGRQVRRNADITVKINVAAEGPPPSKYDPLAIMIGDSFSVMGVQLRDPTEYHTIGPYQGIAGEDGYQLTSIKELKSTEKEVNYRPGEWQRWPQMFNIVLKPSARPPWGLCSSAANGGISLSFAYPRNLRLDQGLDLVLFRGQSTETYTINMIEVSIYEDNV